MNIRFFNTGKYVDLDQHKEPAFSAPLNSVPLRECAYVPLYDPCGGNLYPVIHAGDRCSRFSLLARTKSATNRIGPSWLMSPLSGYVREITRIEHPVIGRTLCAVISPDDTIPPLPSTSHSLNAMTEDGVLRTIHQAGIIDEFDGRPLVEKLLEAKENGIREIAAIALDDSPYVSSALKTVSEFGTEVNEGISIVLKALNGGSAKLAVYDCDEIDIRLDADRFGFVELIRMTGGFPLISKFKRQYYPKGNFLPIGVQALRSASQALTRGLPQTNSIITVSGDCVKHPCNVVVVNGTPIEDVLRFVGVGKVPNYVIAGDTMTGVTVSDIKTPIIAGMRALTVMHSLRRAERGECTRCGRCVNVCPMELLPSEAMRLYELGEADRAAEFGAEHCTGCGACSAVCPSSLEVAKTMRKLKQLKRRHGILLKKPHITVK